MHTTALTQTMALLDADPELAAMWSHPAPEIEDSEPGASDSLPPGSFPSDAPRASSRPSQNAAENPEPGEHRAQRLRTDLPAPPDYTPPIVDFDSLGDEP